MRYTCPKCGNQQNLYAEAGYVSCLHCAHSAPTPAFLPEVKAMCPKCKSSEVAHRGVDDGDGSCSRCHYVGPFAFFLSEATRSLIKQSEAPALVSITDILELFEAADRPLNGDQQMLLHGYLLAKVQEVVGDA